MISMIIPSTTVKSRFLKTLPVGTIYKDPRNNHVYIIEEKKINECLSKIGTPYLGSEPCIEIQVPDKYMKLDNPKRANVLSLMKEKLNQLESLNKDLLTKLDVKSRYQQIKQLMGERKFYETERDIYCVGDECIVYQMRITESKEEAYQLLERYIQCVWKDPSMLARLMEKQVKIQSKLLHLLTQEIGKETLY
jgi:hypothetical protein